MRIQVEWHKPILLSKNSKIVVDRNDLPYSIPRSPGVYFFSRRYGISFQPLYIGETTNIRNRLKTHLNNADIRDILRGIQIRGVPVKQGKKYFHYGTLRGKNGKLLSRRMSLVQKYMIAKAIADKSPLINKQLTDIKTHSVIFSGPRRGRAIYPPTFNIPR